MTKEHKKNNSTYNIAMCGVLTALAMIFSYIESIIPVPIPVPGIKLGVANIAVITILYTLGIKEAVIINILRISLTAMLFGNLNSFLFSIAGAVLSMVTMIVLKKIDSFSYIGVSVSGAIMHNVGQIIAAIFIMGSSAIIYYLPVLIIAGVITGIIIGIVSGIVVKYVKKGAVALTIEYRRGDSPLNNYNNIRILNNTLSFHSFCYFKESGNVSTCYIVAFHSVLLRSIIKIMENINHNVLKLAVYFFKCPAKSF